MSFFSSQVWVQRHEYDAKKICSVRLHLQLIWLVQVRIPNEAHAAWGSGAWQRVYASPSDVLSVTATPDGTSNTAERGEHKISRSQLARHDKFLTGRATSGQTTKTVPPRRGRLEVWPAQRQASIAVYDSSPQSIMLAGVSNLRHVLCQRLRERAPRPRPPPPARQRYQST